MKLRLLEYLRCPTWMSHRLLYALCRLASPAVFTLFTLSAHMGKRVAVLSPLASGLPFRHGTGPFSLVSDLYDRLSAPVERRYSRRESEQLFCETGLQQVRVTSERGWMVAGTSGR